ncbi:BrnT family toxin [bacterium]|nr:BrnT family toxin [bacterium]MBU1753652.1 BrnT family toxin [bacterium]
MKKTCFEWDNEKDLQNQAKHNISFRAAQQAFLDSNRIIAEDISHSDLEPRYYCIGKYEGDILTVRFTYRHNVIRIFGAGYWRKGKNIYEKTNKIHR